jgi:hypothetical protein
MQPCPGVQEQNVLILEAVPGGTQLVIFVSWTRPCEVICECPWPVPSRKTEMEMEMEMEMDIGPRPQSPSAIWTRCTWAEDQVVRTLLARLATATAHLSGSVNADDGGVGVK